MAVSIYSFTHNKIKRRRGRTTQQRLGGRTQCTKFQILQSLREVMIYNLTHNLLEMLIPKLNTLAIAFGRTPKKPVSC